MVVMNILITYCTRSEKEIAEVLRLYFKNNGHRVRILSVNQVQHIDNYTFVVCVIPLPIFIRKFAKMLKGKFSDPGIVLVDPNLRYVIPLVGTHSRGAIDLAIELADLLNLEIVDTLRHEPCRCLEYMAFKLWLKPIRFDLRTRVDLEDVTIGTDSEQICYLARNYFSANIEIVRDPSQLSQYEAVIVSSPIAALLLRNKAVLLKRELVLGVGVCSCAQHEDVRGLPSYAAYLSYTLPERFDLVVLPKHAREEVVANLKESIRFGDIVRISVVHADGPICEALIKSVRPEAELLLHKVKFSRHATFAVGLCESSNRHAPRPQ